MRNPQKIYHQLSKETVLLTQKNDYKYRVSHAITIAAPRSQANQTIWKEISREFDSNKKNLAFCSIEQNSI